MMDSMDFGKRHRNWIVILCVIAASFVLAACAQAGGPQTISTGFPIENLSETSSPSAEVSQDKTPPTLEGVSQNPSPGPTEPKSVEPAPTNARIDDPNEYNFSQLLPYDGIRPVYDPEFATAVDAPLLDDELVMGIAIQGEAKAYPVTVLRFREMVNDDLAGIPILVTW